MGKVYSRNIVQQQVFVPKYAQKSAKGNQNAEGLSTDVPDSKEIPHGGNAALVSEVQGGKPTDWALAILKKSENKRTFSKGAENYCEKISRKV